MNSNKQMMSHSSYEEKLNDPRWKKRRLQIMIRDDCTCQKCRLRKRSNHVHHLVYLKGREPWEYEDEYLITLCERCHINEHLDKIIFNNAISEMLTSGLFYRDVINTIKLRV